jgi:RimJ/RimL family protein N-acetyltransferase
LSRSSDRARVDACQLVSVPLPIGNRLQLLAAHNRCPASGMHTRPAMPQPMLHTQRLLLVPLADRHLDLEVELDSDPEVLRYLSGRARTRDEVVDSHARRMALGRKVAGLGYWMAFGTNGGARGSARPRMEQAGEFVGLLMLPPAHGPDQPDDPSVADLGYRILRRYWRQGLATEASRALLRHAFLKVGVRRVIAQTLAVNAPSRGVMTSVGLSYVRTYFPDSDEPLAGAEQGEVEYELTLGDWQSQARTV